MSAEGAIPALHRAYVNFTGLDIGLNMERERVWFEWLRFRLDDPFTAADLKLVVDHLRRGIRDEARNPGCLRFRNLIGDGEAFDEERAAARKAAHTAAKPRPPAAVAQTVRDAHGATTRVVDNADLRDTSRPATEVSEKALDELKKFKEGLK